MTKDEFLTKMDPRPRYDRQYEPLFKRPWSYIDKTLVLHAQDLGLTSTRPWSFGPKAVLFRTKQYIMWRKAMCCLAMNSALLGSTQRAIAATAVLCCAVTNNVMCFRHVYVKNS